MTFYESTHCGILRIELNEQYIWHWLTQHDLDKDFNVKTFARLVEGALNEFDIANRKLVLDEIISSVYYKYVVKQAA